MFTTAIAILGAVALLSPGFLIVELSDARRARAKRSDLELTLRALVYSVLVHVAFCWWTVWLVDEVGHIGAVGDHLVTVVIYVVVVLVVVPIVELVGGASDSPRYTGGVFGRGSAVGQTPAPHDVYLESVVRIGLDEDGEPYVASLANSTYSLYIPAERIARVLIRRAEDERWVARQPRDDSTEGE